MESAVVTSLWQDALFITVLILVNGFFASAEIALVSARKSRIQQLAAQGDPRAQRSRPRLPDPSGRR